MNKKQMHDKAVELAKLSIKPNQNQKDFDRLVEHYFNKLQQADHYPKKESKLRY